MDRSAIETAIDRHAPAAYSFTDAPWDVNPSDFSRLLEDLRREARRISSLVSLYMDEGVVVQGPRSVRLITVHDAAKCEPSNWDAHNLLRTVGTRNILEPVCITLDERLMELLPKLDCLLRPVHLAGKQISLAPAQPGELRFHYLSRLLDLFATDWLEPFIEAEARRRVETRATLVACQRLCRVIEITKVIIRRDQEGMPKWDEFAQRVRRLSSRWFSLGIERYKGAMPVIREALVVALDLVGVLDAYCTKARVVNLTIDEDVVPPQALLVTDDYTTAYIDGWTPARGLEMMLACSAALGRFVAVLPVSFCLPLLEYSKGKGKFPTFSRFIQSVFGTDGVTGNMERSYVSWERGELLDRMQGFLAKTGETQDCGYTFACNIHSGSAISAAASLMHSHRNANRLRAEMKTLKEVMAAGTGVAGGPVAAR